VFPLHMRVLRESLAHPAVGVLALFVLVPLALVGSLPAWVAPALASTWAGGVLTWLVANRYIIGVDREQERVVRALRAAALQRQVDVDALAFAAMPRMRCPEDCAGCAEDQAVAQEDYERALLNLAVRHGHIPADRAMS
jgi:hypothetical protein